MTHTAQTERTFGLGDVGRFSWHIGDGTQKMEDYCPVDNVRTSNHPCKVSSVWLQDFLGRPIGTTASLTMCGEDNVIATLIEIMSQAEHASRHLTRVD